MDEYDYLFVGKTLLDGLDWPSHTYIFGWDFTWLLFALGDASFGGLTGARTISALFGLISLIGMYVFVRILWENHTAALIATVLLGLEAAHLYSSRLVSYDIVSFTFFLWALPALLLACKEKQKLSVWTVPASIMLSIAVLTKYTTLVYLPLIAALVLFLSPRQFLFGSLLIISLLGSYTWLHAEQLNTLYQIQIKQAHAENALRFDVLLRTANQLLATLALSAAALTMVFFNFKFSAPKIAALLLFSIPLFIYHLLGNNIISLQKHLLYTSAFLLPIVGLWLQGVLEQPSNAVPRTIFVLSCLIGFGFYNIEKLNTMQRSYPDVSAIEKLAAQIQSTHTILSEDPYLYRYLLYDRVSQSHINETTWLDNDLDGLHEIKDVKQAVWDAKFDYVFLNDQQHSELNKTLRAMLARRGYEPMLEHDYVLQTMSGEIRTGTMGLYLLTQQARLSLQL